MNVCRYRYRRQQRWLSFACWILQAGRALCNLRTAGAFPVVASLPPKNRRERSEDWKRVYCSQARICVEFDHVLYMCDAQPTVLVFTTLHETASILHVVGKLSPSTRSMQSTSSATYKYVVTLLKKSKETLHYLRRNEALIRGEIPSLPTLVWPTVRPKEGAWG